MVQPHPRNLTWNLKMVSKAGFSKLPGAVHFQVPAVGFRGCKKRIPEWVGISFAKQNPPKLKDLVLF